MRPWVPVVLAPSGTFKGTYTVFPGLGGRPGMINLLVTAGLGEYTGTIYLGLYERTGDALQLCLGRPGEGRPPFASLQYVTTVDHEVRPAA